MKNRSYLDRKFLLDLLFKSYQSLSFVLPSSSLPHPVDPKRSAKAQALEVLPRLQERFPIERAMMCVRVSVLASHQAQITGQVREWGGHVDARDMEVGTRGLRLLNQDL